MATIDRTSQLAALIRTQLGSQRTAGAKPASHGKVDAATSSPSRAQAPGKQPLAAPPTSAMQAWVAQRVRGLSSEDPQRRRKALRIFLESVLAQELGPQLVGDIAFDQLVEEVLQQMESDQDLRASMDEAGDLLLADSAVPGPS